MMHEDTTIIEVVSWLHFVLYKELESSGYAII